MCEDALIHSSPTNEGLLILLYEDCKKLVKIRAKTIDDMNKPSCMMYPLRCFAVMFPGVKKGRKNIHVLQDLFFSVTGLY